jgi:glycosyltransferase involved in cell wall biosynthesis
MKICIFTTITNPKQYQYAYLEAIENYLAFADSVVVVDGKSSDGSVEKIREKFAKEIESDRLRIMEQEWPDDWDWSELPKHLNLGLDLACQLGDWAIKMDIDYFIHENDFDRIRERLFDYWVAKIPLVQVVKFNIVNRLKGFHKATVPIILNSALARQMNIKFGIPTNGKSDWCYPILVNGFDEKWQVPTGTLFPQGSIASIDCPVFNYDYFFKTKEVVFNDFNRFSRAYATAFDWSWGKTKEESFKVFVRNMAGRIGSHELLPVDHPKFIANRILMMTSEQFGFNNWDEFKGLI